MKHFGFSKSLLLLTSLMLSAWIFVYAQDYIKVYRNGQKVNEFYTTEVDSIVMLPKEDGTGYNVTYWTGDTVFTIPDNEHDSTAIGHITEEQLLYEITNATKVAEPLFEKCSSIQELSKYADEIRNAEGVEKVWFSDNTMFVKLKGWGSIKYYYPPQKDTYTSRITDDEKFSWARSVNTSQLQEFSGIKKACFVELTNYPGDRAVMNRTIKMFQDMDISVQPITYANCGFFANGLFDYDAVFLDTHGCYEDDGLGHEIHWLMTGETIDPRSELARIATYNPSYKSLFRIKGDPNSNSLGRILISEKFIEKYAKDCPNWGKSIIFNAACESLAGTSKTKFNLSNAFVKKGFGVYLGYTDTNTEGHLAGELFFQNMLNGMSAKQAANDAAYKKPDPNAKLEGHYDGNTKSFNLSFIQTKMGDIEDESDDEGTKIKVKGSVKLYSPRDVNHTYGFYLSEKNDFESGKMLPGFTLESSGCKVTNGHTVEFEQTLTDKELEAGKPYYICPYLFDGESYCLAEKLEPLYANSVETLDPGYAKADIALLQGQFICGKAVEEAGFRIGTTEDLKEFVDIKVNEAYGRLQANYWSVVTGLHPSIKYYYKSYVKVDGQTITGNMMTLQTSRVIDGEITSYDHKASGYVVTDNNGYVGFITNMKYKAPLMSSLTTQWGVYMDNYNNTGEANGWASSLGNSATEDSQDITVLITKGWFDTKNYSSFQAVKKARMGVYKVVQYDGVSDVFFSEPQEVTFIYDQKPYLEFLTHNCTKPVTSTDPYDGKEKWKTTVYGNYSVTGSFWVNKIDFVVESGDANDHVGTWTIEGDGTKKYSINYYTSKNLEYYSSKFRFDMILDNGARVRSANSIILEVTSSSRATDVTPITGEQYSNGVKGASLHSTTKDRDFQLKSIKPLKSGLKTDENFSCPVLQR